MQAFKYQLNADDITTSTDATDFLGQGSYGKVRRVYTKKYGVSAAKIFHVTGTVDRQDSALDVVKKEADTLAFASHENVVRFQAVSHWSSYVAIIMQYEVRGSLHQLLRNRAVEVLPFKLRFRFAYEIVKALVFLHNFGVDERMVHGDLKSSNVLLTEDLRARVADFGAAHIGTKTCDQTRHPRPADTLVHSVVFTAPEFLQNIYTRRTTAMDVFSFGRILYQLLLREIPFYDWSGANMSVDIINGAEPNYDRIPGIRRSLIDALDEDLAFFDLLKNYMDKCCDRDVNKRPSMPTTKSEMKEVIDRVPPVSFAKSVAIVLNQLPEPKRDSEESSRNRLSQLSRFSNI